MGSEVGVNLYVEDVVDTLQQPFFKEYRRRRKYTQVMRLLGLITGDGLSLVVVLSLILVLSSSLHLELRVSSYNFGSWDTKLVCISLGLLSWAVATRITQAYELFNTLNRFRGTLSVLFALTLALILWMVLSTPFFTGDMSAFVKLSALFFIMAMPTLCIWRIMFAEAMSLARFRHQAVIVGTTAAGKTIAKELRHVKRPSATILGFISENTEVKVQEDGVPILGGRNILHHLGQNGMIDMIITAIDYDMYPELFQEVFEMAQLGVSVVPMPIAYEYASGRVPVEHIREKWSLALPLNTAVLLMILPFLAIFIYIDSPGPIFYRQDRSGVKGKTFRIFKFRSMRIDAEQNGHAIWATGDDPRVTRVGRIMRRIHLDELPQVLNILWGDMSLIGPRPEREAFNTQLEKTIPFYRCRLMVKPGLTGWAQVMYHYCSTDNDALIKLQYDLYCIKHQSFMLDICIILKTVIEVILHRGT